MAFITYDNSSGALIQVSDYELTLPNNGCLRAHHLSKAAIEAEYTWDPVEREFIANDFRIMTKLEFLRKFTMQERINIREAAKTDPVIFDGMELLNLASSVDRQDVDVIRLLTYFTDIGILAAGRKEEIVG